MEGGPELPLLEKKPETTPRTPPDVAGRRLRLGRPLPVETPFDGDPPLVLGLARSFSGERALPFTFSDDLRPISSGRFACSSESSCVGLVWNAAFVKISWSLSLFRATTD
jgi:hypothetical protein